MVSHKPPGRSATIDDQMLYVKSDVSNDLRRRLCQNVHVCWGGGMGGGGGWGV